MLALKSVVFLLAWLGSVDLVHAVELWASDQADRSRLYRTSLPELIISGPLPVAYQEPSLALVADLATDIRRNPQFIWGITRTVAGSSARASKLLHIDPRDQRELSRVVVDTPLNSLAIDPIDGSFYGADATSLYRIDPTTGSTTLIGSTTHAIDGGLGFTPSGELIAAGRLQSGIFRVDKQSGSTQLIVGSEGVWLADIAFDPSTSSLHGITTSGSIVLIDSATGETTAAVSSYPITRPSGLAFTTIPEPTSSALSVVAFGFLIARPSRRDSCNR